jgi:hypothetical protein
MSLSQFFSQATSAHHFLLDVGLQNFPRSDPRKCIQKVVAFVCGSAAVGTQLRRAVAARVEDEGGIGGGSSEREGVYSGLWHSCTYLSKM